MSIRFNFCRSVSPEFLQSFFLSSDLSIVRRTREEKTDRREVKVVSLAYSSSVQWNILLLMIRDMMMTIILVMIMIEWSPCEEVGLPGTLRSHQEEHR